MPADSIKQTLKELIVDRLFLDLAPADIGDDTALVEYGVDSFLLLEVIVAIEEEFGVKIEQGDITSETLKSVNSLAELVESKQSE